MSARNPTDQIQQGILSPGLAANLAKRNRASIRNWVRDGTLKPYRLRPRGEIRVCALELMKYMIALKWPISKELVVAAYNYARSTEYSSVEYCKEILRTFDTTTPESRCDIPFVPNPPEAIEWDATGNMVKHDESPAVQSSPS